MRSSEFLSYISSRSSVRSFTDEPVTEDELNFMLRCASTAPSAGNRESWDVVVVDDEDIRAGLSEAALGQLHVREAPVALVVCANYVRSMSTYGERGILYAIQDATIAATYFMLAAHALHLHTCWTGAFDEDAVREVLDLPPHIRPIAILPVGHGRPSGERTGRMPPEEHLHRNTWGQV
ncbi:MAG: nitroreductase family protein [Methanoculleaceae archaeon]